MTRNNEEARKREEKHNDKMKRLKEEVEVLQSEVSQNNQQVSVLTFIHACVQLSLDSGEDRRNRTSHKSTREGTSGNPTRTAEGKDRLCTAEGCLL